MVLAAIVLAAAAAAPSVDREPEAGVQSMLEEEAPDVFLAKATLQQYLSRVARKDWDGARRLTHRRTLSVLRDLKRRVGFERHNLAPWAHPETELKAYRFVNARQVSPGVVAVEVSEDTFRTEEQGMSADDPAVYLLFKSHGGFLIGDKKAGVELADVSDASVRLGYPGYVDGQARAQARRTDAFQHGVHR